MSELVDILLRYGADVSGTMNRFMNDEELYATCLESFLVDPAFEELEAAVARGDYAQAFDYAHTLKGVAGNMGLTPVYEALTAVVEKLRNHDYGDIDNSISEVSKEFSRLKKLF
ncbi:MAG: Hpt domain-containing protein [Oscillospiraceae bacterium]